MNKASQSENPKTVHYAANAARLRQANPMCGYVGPDDDISLDPRRCNCPECQDWIRAPEESP